MNEVFEAIQLLNGDVYIYCNGYKEEADPKDVFKFSFSLTQEGRLLYQFSRFDFNPAKILTDSKIRLNKALIAFAWLVDPNSDAIQNLKKAEIEMNAKKAGLILPK